MDEISMALKHENQITQTELASDTEEITSPPAHKNVELQADNRAVHWSRLMVFVVLASAAAVLGYLTFYYVHEEELENFRTEVRRYFDNSRPVGQ